MIEEQERQSPLYFKRTPLSKALTISEAAEYLNISGNVIRKRIQSGELEATTVERYFRTPKGEQTYARHCEAILVEMTREERRSIHENDDAKLQDCFFYLKRYLIVLAWNLGLFKAEASWKFVIRPFVLASYELVSLKCLSGERTSIIEVDMRFFSLPEKEQTLNLCKELLRCYFCYHTSLMDYFAIREERIQESVEELLYRLAETYENKVPLPSEVFSIDKIGYEERWRQYSDAVELFEDEVWRAGLF